MFRPRLILAAVDFSDSSRLALSFAARLANQCKANLHVLHAEDPLLAAAAEAQRIDLARETREELVTFARSAAPAGDHVAAYHVVTGKPAQVIRDIGMREKADVVVLGMRGISAIEQIIFGSTTEHVLRAAELPIFAIPDTWTPRTPDADNLEGLGPVVAAVEFSEPSLEAANAACDLAALLHTSVEAIHVTPAVRVLNRWQASASAAVEERATTEREQLAQALEKVRGSTPLQLRVEAGNVAQRIAAALEITPTRRPVLVVGRRSHASGSTAYRAISLAAAPMLQYVRTANGDS
jgi:nucleotide-binding universal stress UspA family protein